MEGALYMRFWKKFIMVLVINIGLTLLVLLIKGFELRIHYVDAFSIAGAVSIFLGLLSWAASAGAFDTIGYGLSSLRSADRRDKDLYEYILRKKEKQSRQKINLLTYLAVGVIFLLISILIPIE